MKTLLVCLLMCGFSAIGAPILVLNGTNVVHYMPRANTPSYFNAPNNLILLPVAEWKEGVTNYVVPPIDWSWPEKWKLEGTNLVKWTQAERDAEAAAAASAALSAQREASRGSVTNTTSEAVALRATVSVLIDEVNILRGRINALHGNLKLASTNQSAFGSATNRSVLHGLNEFADRTATQARTAIVGKINDGSEE